MGVRGGSDSKESDCNAGDLGSIPGLEDPLEEVMASNSSILAWRIPRDRGAWQEPLHGVSELHMAEQVSTAQQTVIPIHLTASHGLPYTNS